MLSSSRGKRINEQTVRKKIDFAVLCLCTFPTESVVASWLVASITTNRV